MNQKSIISENFLYVGLKIFDEVNDFSKNGPNLKY